MHENYLHIVGESLFTYDMDVNQPCLYGKGLFSTVAKGRITKLDTTMARSLEGVKCVLTSKDIPGKNDFSVFEGDEPCLVEELVQFYGDTIALVAATTPEIAAKAVKLIEVEYEELTPILTIDQAIQEQSFLYPKPLMLQQGDPDTELHRADYYVEGVVESPPQEHWYLETQCAMAIPREDGEMEIFSSTQGPAEVQEVAARVLGISVNQVTVKVKRIGGGFGGKETWSTKPAAWASLLAWATGQSVYFRLNREEDQMITCKRHAFKTWYKASFDKNGKIRAVVFDSYSNGGYSRDLSEAIMWRALLHVENTYYCPNIRFTGSCCKTNMLSFGAYRGFGAPQSVLVMELIIERIATTTGIDAWDVRRENFFSANPEDKSHYSYYTQPTIANRLFDIEKILRKSSDYDARVGEVEKFNASHKILKRGIAVSPVKFGIAFGNILANQAGALINIYKDGSVQVNHGGVDMGQGLTAKVRKIAADTLGVTFDTVRVMATTTDKVPNASPTAASTGIDLNGMAVMYAAQQLRERLATKAAEILNCDVTKIIFKDNKVWCEGHSEQTHSFKEIAHAAYCSRIGLSSVGYYKTPNIYLDKETMTGYLFSYFVYGMAVSEVEVNLLTGDMQIVRADILHDVGKSLDPGIDKGQIEGAYVQGAGWLTMENIVWDEKGRPLNVSPDTYKIPTVQDIPLDFRVTLLEDQANPHAVFQSKALGEPPFMYVFSVYIAQQKALNSK